MLVVIVLLVMIVTTGAVMVGVSSMRSTTLMARGEVAHAVAESGAENAILGLLRDPSYGGEADLRIGEGSATIVVSGSAPKTIVSTGSALGMVRKVEVVVQFASGSWTVESWQER